MIAIPKVRDAIHAGVKEASIKYLEWSRGRKTLHESGVEGLIVSEIASQLYKRIQRVGHDDSIQWEVPYTVVQEESGAMPMGRTVETFKGSKRADLVVFNSSEKPKYLLEIKRRFYRKDLIAKDIRRLADVANKCGSSEDGSLKRGFLAAFDQQRVHKSRSRRQMVEQFEERVWDSIDPKRWHQIKSCIAKPLPTKHSPPNHVSFSLCVEVRAG